ncbi:isochorismatase family protein [Verminephrobacter aporrectodeae subsp. tuberculatae]|uniref:isochorismatase family protein n=1 Tax=Verminephrobacter aporrectodeae TaxID=1110389 RepID=UPI0022378F5A|nr:isochorismatase family protein [Verminephrobacter aporrectodeae]MCW5256026.1 isochorismatase family protein [Verminephrobacter aporrectodeae subsp. tuberculatae]
MTIPRIASYPMPSQVPTGRVAWAFEPGHAALLVHDMQDYFLDFYDRGAAPIPRLLANTRHLLDAAHAAGMPVFYSAQPSEQSPADRGLLSAMWGPGLTAQPAQAAAICAELAPAPVDVVLTKWRYSAFQRSDLESRLRALGRNQLVVCGVYAHIGCLMSACEAFMRDIQPFLVADALADFSAEDHHMALNYVAQCCGRAVLSDDLLPAFPAQAAVAPMLPTSLAGLLAEISRSLQLPPGELAAEDPLMDWGLDSIRLMGFVESWRQAGRDVSFVQLAQATSAAAWWAVLEAAPPLPA